MENSTVEFVMSLARLHHHDGILDITKGEDLWGGLDYLPCALKSWLKEGEYEQRANHTATRGETMLSIIVAQEMVKATVEAIELLGLQKFKFVNGSQKRDVSNMYIYEEHV